MATLVVTIVALGAIGWFAYLVGSGSRRDRKDPVPANLSASQTDDEMETRRLDRTLAGAVISAAFLTLAMPIYYLGELDRQEGFVEEFGDASLERGHEVWEEFGCGDCHGAAGGGGVAAFLEERSQVNVSGWSGPRPRRYLLPLRSGRGPVLDHVRSSQYAHASLGPGRWRTPQQPAGR